MIANLQKLDPEIIEKFLEIRDHEKLGIPEKLANYILQINQASNLFKSIRSITKCAERLQKDYPELSIATCKSRVYDAINYLNSNSTVTSEAWDLYYADQLMLLFEVTLLAQKFTAAIACLEKSHMYRERASANAINPDLLKIKPQIVSPDFEIERMGVKSQGLLASYKTAMRIIDSRDIPENEKDRLRKELSSELNIYDITADTNE